jgi:phosphate/sulfate permease
VTPVTVFCAQFGGIIWNLATWWLGLPSSSSHALVGGLCGASLAAAHGKWSVIKLAGLKTKVLVPMFTAPVVGIIGGWRIIRTLGHKVVRMQPIHGFAAQTTAAGIIHLASHCGIPLSTTQVISTCIVGVGTTKRFSAVKWGVVGKIVWAWVLTIPVTALLAYGLQRFCIAMKMDGAL